MLNKHEAYRKAQKGGACDEYPHLELA
jgi:hypothetical protein